MFFEGTDKLIKVFNVAIRTTIYGYFFIFFFAVLISLSCSVKKNKIVTADKEKEYSFSQNFTARYNILYNAKLLLEDEAMAITRAKKINYQIRQSVFDEPTAQGDANQLMDSVIKKGYDIVNEKSESKYVSEGHYLIAQANYLKGSYYTAIEFFSYLIKHSEDHPEYVPLAYAWKSRAMHQIGRHDAAAVIIDSAFMFMDDNKETETFLHAAKANSLIRQGKELDAIPYLENAVETSKNRHDRYRWRFLLGQLYVQQENNAKALEYFDALSKANVSFDMAFEASLQAALLRGGRYDDVDASVRPLRRMLREGKNDGYQDQILHQIGLNYLQGGKDTIAREYFNRSLRQDNGSQYQKTETYMTLADHHFDIKKHRESQLYYDSVAGVLPDDYTDVNRIRRKLTYMGQLNSIYEEIAWQDTLLYLGALTPLGVDTMTSVYARANVNDRLREIAHRKTLAKLAKRGKLPSQAASFSANNNLFPTAQGQGNNYSDTRFYFNNPDAVMLGNSEFRRRWGDRNLTDNWRFSSLGGSSGGRAIAASRQETKGEEELEEEFDADAYFIAEKNRYMEAVPTNQAAFDKTHQIIHDNMILIGNIYRDYTRDNLESALAFEAFLSRYPNTTEGPYVYYTLYRMYDGIDQGKSEYYKGRLIALFPSTLHAQIALDPNYMDKLNRERQVLDRAFEKMFAAYLDDDHAAVIAEADRHLEADYMSERIVSQIQYLRALSLGRTASVQDFKTALGDIVEAYPQDSLVTPLAMENLAYMDSNQGQFANRTQALYDIDYERVAFANEPNMTPWPSLVISGDYRTSVALHEDEPEEEIEEIVEEVIAQVEEEIEQEELVEEEITEPAVVEEEEEIFEIEEIEEAVAVVIEEEEEVVAIVEEVEEEARAEAKALGQIERSRRANSGLANLPMERDIEIRDIGMPKVGMDFGPNDYRDKELFPEEATYYFVINVMDNMVNLAPSRYGIGQFNRLRYARARISHQLTNVNNQNQLVYIGPFSSYTAAKEYETRIRPMMLDIMKIPQENYNIFVITEETMDTLTDDIQIRHYREIYLEQP